MVLRDVFSSNLVRCINVYAFLYRPLSYPLPPGLLMHLHSYLRISQTLCHSMKITGVEVAQSVELPMLRAGRPWFYSQQGQRFFLFSTASRRALLPGIISPGLKWPGREADHPFNLVPGLGLRETIPPLPQYVLMT
jgi:hypothetical protein